MYLCILVLVYIYVFTLVYKINQNCHDPGYSKHHDYEYYHDP